jgi:hypothetical protein
MRQVDEIRFMRPISPDAHPFRATVMRTARITAIYSGFAISGSFAVAITCLVATANGKFVLCGLLIAIVGLVLAYTTAMRRPIARVRAKTPPAETSAVSAVLPQLRLEALVPVLLLYTSQRLTRRYVNMTQKPPHDYVYQAFARVMDDSFDARGSSLMSVLCSTIDALIARDAMRRTREG